MKHFSAEKREYRVIAAGKFKATCLQLLDEICENRNLTLIVTKRGKPVGELTAPPKDLTLGGPTVTLEGDQATETGITAERHPEKKKKKNKSKKRKP